MNREIKRYIDDLFAAHSRKMRNLIGRGEVDTVQEDPKLQTNQIKMLDEEIIEGAERCQQYGFNSHPHQGAECFVVFANGDRAHPLILSVDDRRYRLKAEKSGEVIIYTDEGDYVYLRRDNTIEVKTKHLIVNAEKDVTINTEVCTVNASKEITTKTQVHNLEADKLNWKVNSWSVQGLNEGGGAVATGTMGFDIDGGVKTTEDQIAGGISQINHVHTEVLKGGDTTGKPQD